MIPKGVMNVDDLNIWRELEEDLRENAVKED